MDCISPSLEAIVQMSEVSKGKFSSLNHFARSFNVTISGLYFYVALGALNIEKLDGGNVIYSAIKPTQAAKVLTCDSKKIARWCVSLAKRGLLTRDWGGAYKVENITTWYEISKLVNVAGVDALLQSVPLVFAAADPAFLDAQHSSAQARDR